MSRLGQTSLEPLEPYDGKLSSTVLRGESPRKGADLLDIPPNGGKLQPIINNMYRSANIVLFVLAIFVVMGCSCSKTLCERNIQDDILNIDKFRKQSKKEYRYIEEDAERLFANSAAVYPDTLYRQQYTSLQGYFYGETGFDLYSQLLPFPGFEADYHDAEDYADEGEYGRG